MSWVLVEGRQVELFRRTLKRLEGVSSCLAALVSGRFESSAW